MGKKSIIKGYLQPAFLLCVLILAVGAAGRTILIKGLGGYLKKEPIPLKKSLELLDENLLLPYKVQVKEKQENEDIVENLGTKNYITWYLEDESEPVNSPVRKCVLFITYYDLPDKVPHVPEICYVGGGSEIVKSESLTIEIRNGDFDRKIPIKYILFGGGEKGFLGKDIQFPVLYCFYVNGHYGNSREDTRYYLNKYFFYKYSFFSKVEWKFYNITEFGMQVFPDEERSVEASRKLLSVLLPVLEREHWPDWNK
jgi:hypothetical protein